MIAHIVREFDKDFEVLVINPISYFQSHSLFVLTPNNIFNKFSLFKQKTGYSQAKTTHLKLLFSLILCYVMIALRLFFIRSLI